MAFSADFSQLFHTFAKNLIQKTDKMRKRITLLFALATLQLTLTVAQNANPCHYIYFANGSVEAYPVEYVKSLDVTSSEYKLTLVDDTQKKWPTAQVDSVVPNWPVKSSTWKAGCRCTR